MSQQCYTEHIFFLYLPRLLGSETPAAISEEPSPPQNYKKGDKKEIRFVQYWNPVVSSEAEPYTAALVK